MELFIQFVILLVVAGLAAFVAFKYGQTSSNAAAFERGRKDGTGLVPSQAIRTSELPHGVYINLGDFMERESGNHITLLRFSTADERIVRLIDRAPPKAFGIDHKGNISTYTSGYTPPVRNIASAANAGQATGSRAAGSSSVRVSRPPAASQVAASPANESDASPGSVTFDDAEISREAARR